MNTESITKLIRELAEENAIDLDKNPNHPKVLQWKSDYKFWSDYAKIYPSLEKSRPYKDLMRTISEFVKPENGHIWLDAGCGPGSTMDIVLNGGEIEKIIGVDFSDLMLRHVNKRYEKHPRKHKISVHSHDLRSKLPYPDKYFNGIISNLVLPYITEHQNEKSNPLKKVISEMYRVLKVGGHLIWTTPVHEVNFTKVFLASWKNVIDIRSPKNIIHGPAILRYALKIQKKGKNKEYTFWPESQIQKEMTEAGFTDIVIKTTFAGQAHVVRGIRK